MTSEATWSAVDEYFSTAVLPDPDPVLEHALSEASRHGLPEIQVSPPLGRLLQLLVMSTRARRVLEIGTLGGYSTIWLARGASAIAREGGRAEIITCEVNPAHAEVAEANFEHAGFADLIEIRVGPAATTLAALVEEGAEPFDFVFIDADKVNNPVYFAAALRLSHVGALIVVDNVVRGGRVADAGSDEPDVVGTRRLVELLGATPAVTATAVQTVGVKGYDGFAIALVTSQP